MSATPFSLAQSMPNTGHLLNLEEPEVVNDLLRGFMGKTIQRRGGSIPDATSSSLNGLGFTG